MLARPAFQEPQWGDAPPPLASEITEITLTHRLCRGVCTEERIAFRRDGLAARSFWTRNNEDSSFNASIDSAAFAQLAAQFLRHDFFRGHREGEDEALFSNDVYVLSVATLCRRKTDTVGTPWLRFGTELRVAVDTVVSSLAWERCCRY